VKKISKKAENFLLKAYARLGLRFLPFFFTLLHFSENQKRKKDKNAPLCTQNDVVFFLVVTFRKVLFFSHLHKKQDCFKKQKKLSISG